MAADDRYWLDILERKHECGPSLAPYLPIDVSAEGRVLKVLIPERYEPMDRLEIKAVLSSDSLATLIAYYPGNEEVPYERAILMVARRQEEDGTYIVHVWHELYHPWALEHLGLSDRGGDR